MKKISKNSAYELKGLLVPFYQITAMPIFLKLEDKVFLPLFTTKIKYEEAVVEYGLASVKCREIDDPEQFLNSIIESKKKVPFHVIIDPYKTDDGNTRFSMLAIDEEEKSYL